MFRRTPIVDRALALQHAYGPLRHLYDHDVAWRLRVPRRIRLLRQLVANLGTPGRHVCRRLDGKLEAKLTALASRLGWGRQLIFDIHWLTVKMNQGGTEVYVASVAANRLEETLQALHELRVDRLHRALLEACDEIFEGPVPRQRSQRQEAVERQAASHRSPHRGSSQRRAKETRAERATRVFFDEEIHLVEAVREWVSKHVDEFGGS